MGHLILNTIVITGSIVTTVVVGTFCLGYWCGTLTKFWKTGYKLGRGT